jgi:hypothetical protein
MSDREACLDDLLRCYMRAALAKLLAAENEKARPGANRPGLDPPQEYQQHEHDTRTAPRDATDAT